VVLALAKTPVFCLGTVPVGACRASLGSVCTFFTGVDAVVVVVVEVGLVVVFGVLGFL
jgi:hypothetical protein